MSEKKTYHFFKTGICEDGQSVRFGLEVGGSFHKSILQLAVTRLRQMASFPGEPTAGFKETAMIINFQAGKMQQSQRNNNESSEEKNKKNI